MKRRTILFVINADTPDAQIRDATEAAAASEDRLLCLLLGASPALPMYAYGVPPYGGINIPDNWSELLNDAQQKQSERNEAVEALLAKSNASGDVYSAICATMDVKHHVGQAARVSDEAFFAQNLRDSPDMLREAIAGVLFESPIGLRLNGAAAQTPKRIFVSWDGSEAASSAAHAALPYLKASEDIVIGCIDPVILSEHDRQEPGADIAAWLSHHGCKVTVSQYPSGGREVAQCIQDRAREFGADLVVMGAYGHARMIQTVLGGTTRTMIEQEEMPILLAH